MPARCETSRTLARHRAAGIGYAFDRFLPYFTGGAAFGDVKGTTPRASAAPARPQFGWTVGGGIEYAFLDNWSAKIEYLYVDLGTATVQRDLLAESRSTSTFKTQHRPRRPEL